MTRAELKPRRVEVATAALRQAALKGDSLELARQLQKGAQIDHVHLAPEWSIQTESAGKLITSGVTALLHAASHGRVACVRQLLAAGANANTANQDGFTALHVASTNGNKEITEMLLAADASVSARAGAWKIGCHPLAIARGASISVLEAALPEAVRHPLFATECGLCGKTEAEATDFFRMPCSEASISQVAASAGDDDALQLEQHIMCGTCAAAAVANHSLQCGICKDPCIPLPAAWVKKQADIASDLDTARSMATAAWAAVSQAAAAGDPRTVGDADHMAAVTALILSAIAANDFMEELSSAVPLRIPPDTASSSETWNTTMQELDAAMDAAAVVAGRYARRQMGKKYGQLDDAIEVATEAGLLPSLTCSRELECGACSAVPYTGAESHMRGAILQCSVCEEALCVQCAVEMGGLCDLECGECSEVPLPPDVAQALAVYNAAAGQWEEWAKLHPVADEDEDEEGVDVDEGPNDDDEDDPINAFWPGTKLWKTSLKEMLEQSSTHAPPAPPESAARGSYAAVASRHAASAGEGEEEEDEDEQQVEDPHDTYRAAAAAAAVQALPLLDDQLVCLEGDDDPTASRCPVCRETRRWQGDELHEGGCGRWLRLPCAHTLCIDCARKTAQVQSTCPECRAPFLPQPSAGDRVRLHFPPKRPDDEDGKGGKGDKGGKEQPGGDERPEQSSLWETLQALLHLKTGVVQGAAGEGSYTVKLDSPVADEESGMGLEVVPLAW